MDSEGLIFLHTHKVLANFSRPTQREAGVFPLKGKTAAAGGDGSTVAGNSGEKASGQHLKLPRRSLLAPQPTCSRAGLDVTKVDHLHRLRLSASPFWRSEASSARQRRSETVASDWLCFTHCLRAWGFILNSCTWRSELTRVDSGLFFSCWGCQAEWSSADTLAQGKRGCLELQSDESWQTNQLTPCFFFNIMHEHESTNWKHKSSNGTRVSARKHGQVPVCLLVFLSVRVNTESTLTGQKDSLLMSELEMQSIVV